MASCNTAPSSCESCYPYAYCTSFPDAACASMPSFCASTCMSFLHCAPLPPPAPAPPPSACPTGWVESAAPAPAGRCYYNIPYGSMSAAGTGMTQHECVNACATHGANPVCISSTEELKFLQGQNMVAYDAWANARVWTGVYQWPADQGERVGWTQCTSGETYHFDSGPDFMSYWLSDGQGKMSDAGEMMDCAFAAWRAPGTFSGLADVFMSVVACSAPGMDGDPSAPIHCLCERGPRANGEVNTSIAYLDVVDILHAPRGALWSSANRATFVGASFVLAAIALLPTISLIGWRLLRRRASACSSGSGSAPGDGDGAISAAMADELSTISNAQDAGAALRLRISFSLFQTGFLVAVVGVTPIGLSSAKLPNWFCIDYPRAADFGMLGLLPPGMTLMCLAIMPTDGVAIYIGSALVGGTFAYWGQWFFQNVSKMLPMYIEMPAFRAFMSPYLFTFAAAGVTSLLTALIALPSLVPHVGVFRRFALPPRVRLRRLWLCLRLAFLGMGAFLVQEVWAQSLPGGDGSWGGEIYKIVTWSSFILCGLLTPRAWRARVTRVLGRIGSKDSDEQQQAASVAALVGGRNARQALDMATRRFRVLPLDVLAASDLQTNDDTGLFAKTESATLGTCDAFISHSWRDDGAAKHAAVLEWSEVAVPREEERVPTIWLDKACIDQDNIDESLAALPIFLSGCKSLVAVAGPSYPTRLWCVMELCVPASC